MILLIKQFLEDESPKNRSLKQLYQLIHQKGPVSKADLAEVTKVKLTTLSRMIDELLQKKYIRECGYGESSGGRPPLLYHIEPAAGYIVGVDISRIATKVLLLNLTLQTIEMDSFAMTEEHTPTVTLEKIKTIIAGMLEKHQISPGKLLGIGIGTVGPLDPGKGLILEPESFLAKGWVQVEIVKMLGEAFPVEIRLQNGANTAVLGEYYHSPIRFQNMLYCISGVGLRCGVISNGQLAAGKIGDATTYGHMIVDIDGKPCTCGKKGCLLSYVSLPVLLNEVQARIRRGEQSILTQWTKGNADKATINQLIEALKQNDTLTQQVILQSAVYFGIGLANLVNILHPEQVVLSGPLFYESPLYYQKVVDTASEHVCRTERDHVVFHQGRLQADAAAVGAAIMIFDAYLEKDYKLLYK